MFATLERVRFSVLVLPSYRDTSCLRLVWVWCGKVTGPGLPINVAALWGVSAYVCTHMETNHALDGIHSAVILQSSKYCRLQHASDLKLYLVGLSFKHPRSGFTLISVLLSLTPPTSVSRVHDPPNMRKPRRNWSLPGNSLIRSVSKGPNLIHCSVLFCSSRFDRVLDKFVCRAEPLPRRLHCCPESIV